MYNSIQIIPDNGSSIYALEKTGNAITGMHLNGKNTWDDWHLIPASRPLFNPPTPKTNYIDIPGANGSIDASEILAGHYVWDSVKNTPVREGFPVYENMKGSNVFYVMNGYGSWHNKYSEIMGYLHGRRVKAVLEDDPAYYYQGRMSINQWKSEKDWSKIVLDYDFYPYKFEAVAPGDHDENNEYYQWLWDPFSFVDGVIRNGYWAAQGGIVLDQNNSYHSSLTVIGRTMPVCPVFWIRAYTTPASGTTVTISMQDETFHELASAVATLQPVTGFQPFRFPQITIANNDVRVLVFTASNNQACGINVEYRGGRL